MVKQGAFRTDRRYTKHGQRVGFCQFEHSMFVFYDVDRCVFHLVNLPDDWAQYPPGLFKQAIMQEYDAGRYCYGYEFGPVWQAALEVARKHAVSL